MRVNIVDRYDEFIKLREEWNLLLMNSLNPTVFLTHQWIDTWWKSFGEGKELFILLVYEGNRLVAIAPFMRHNGIHTIIGKTRTKLKLRMVEFITNDHSHRADLIVAHNYSGACNAIIDFLLKENRNSWDILSLDCMLENSPTLKYLKNSLSRHNISFKQYPELASPYLRINGRWEEYFKKRQRRFREQLKSRLRKLEKSGSVRLARFQSRDELENVLEEVFEVAAKSWKAGEGTALSSTPEIRGFYSDLANTAAREGWLELFILYLDDKPLVFEFCLKFDNKLYLLKTEYDEGYRTYGVGNMMQWKLLENIFESDITEFDFLGPSDRWKMFWAKENVKKHIIFYAFNKNFKGRILKFAYDIKDIIKKIGPLAKVFIRHSRGLYRESSIL